MTYIARNWAGKNAINSFLRKLLAGKKSAFRKRVCLWLWSSAHRLSILAYRYDIEIINFTMNRSTLYRWHPYKFVYKQKNGLLPEIFENLFRENNQIHYSYNTRQNKNIHVRHSENKYSKMTTEQQGTNIWNSIPVLIRNIITEKLE